MLYVRMLLIMLVTLYTSRVIINALGVVDFGIYNIVAGIVVLFSFLSSAMTAASQRYLSIAIGTTNESFIQRVFSASLLSHLILAVAVVLIAETIGLWLLYDKLVIPYERKAAAFSTYHIVVVITFLNIIRVPFNASIISHERMDFYAYMSILEAILKLAIVFLLQLFDFDKLISYSLLLMLVAILVNVVYIYYCIKNFSGHRITLVTSRELLKEMTTFSGWNILGGIADVGYKQGTNIILNIFCGVTLNAALGITNQIRTAIYSFVSNLQVAANPQIIKSYAEKNSERVHSLVCSISKCSFFLMLFLAIPLIINMDYLLRLWLINPPEHSVTFVQLILVFCLFDSLSGPLWTSMQATGKIRNYLLWTSSMLLLNLPLTYMALWLGYAPESILVIQIIIVIITLVIRVCFLKKYIGLSYTKYFRSVILPILSTAIFSVPFPLLFSNFFTEGLRLFSTSLISTCSVGGSIYLCGLTKDERSYIIRLIKRKALK